MLKLAERLVYARNRAGLTGAQVRERTQIGESSLSEFENGKREPNLSQLQKLARAYQRSIAFFLESSPIRQELVLWRERPEKEATEIEARFLRLCEQYHNLEIWCNEHAPLMLPQEKTKPADTYTNSDAEELAKSVRRELQLGDRPGPGLLNTLEEVCGIKIFHLEFEPTGTAASTLNETFGAAILLNALNVRWRRNFDLGHELFHVLTWDIFRTTNDEQTSVIPSDREERLADIFAANLLMPSEATKTAVNTRRKGGTLTFEALFDIAREFDVSVESLLWRIHYLFRSHAETESTKQDIEKARRLASVFGEREQTKVPVRPSRYKALAIRALRHGEMSMGRFAEYLDITRQKAMEYAEQESGDDEEIQFAPA
jgi:XRE family transcriptional regulator, fatty acid utilization regulator